ncbi:sulfotransferase [Ruegeria conchae]|uniref:sulfotransferase n=1 Tax=Ruegeria conchae TaxID=981384 RepID=UPI00147B720B|nr:sulfotransferase [Ruegeria conchae]UWR01969.1 sulfotransferase [Ruegeria conchae]
MSKPIYLIATERSGSNFLRKSLSERQSEVCCTIPPAHFLRTFNFWSHCLGPFHHDDTWLRLISFYQRSTLERAVPWHFSENVEIIAQTYEDRYGDKRDPVRLADHFYTRFALRQGFLSYLCKDIWLNQFALEIASALPAAQFIHLVRDPRDVAASQKRRPFGLQDVGNLASDWKTQTDQMLRYAQDTELSERTMLVRYEDLISAQDDTCDALLSNLKLEKAPGIDTGSMPTTFHEWKNLDRPAIVDNAGKFRKHLSSKETRIVESLTWHTMRLLNYKPLATARPDLGFFERRVYSKLAQLRQRIRFAIKLRTLRSEPINRRASRELVHELEHGFR